MVDLRPADSKKRLNTKNLGFEASTVDDVDDVDDEDDDDDVVEGKCRVSEKNVTFVELGSHNNSFLSHLR